VGERGKGAGERRLDSVCPFMREKFGREKREEDNQGENSSSRNTMRCGGKGEKLLTKGGGVRKGPLSA